MVTYRGGHRPSATLPLPSSSESSSILSTPPLAPAALNFSPPSMSKYISFEIVMSLCQGIGFCYLVLTTFFYSKIGGGVQYKSNENFHALFMTYGLVFFNGEALLAYRFLRSDPKLVSKIIHGCFHTIAVAMFSVALAQVIKSKTNNGYGHFYSFHSWFGLAIMFVYIVQFLFGLFNYGLPGVPLEVRAALMPYHRATGSCLFVCSVAQVIIGNLQYVLYLGGEFDECYGAVNCYDRLEIVYNISLCLLVLYAILVMVLVQKPSWKRAKTPEEEQ